MIKFLQFNSQLKTQTYPALCLFGNDEWVKHRALEYVFASCGVTQDDFAVDTLDAPSVDDIQTSCLTQSIFGDKRIVVCENFAFGKGNTETNKVKEAKAQLSKLIESCDGSFCLVFVTNEQNIFSGVRGLEFVDCNRLDSRSVEKWIVSYCKKAGVNIDPACTSKIATYCLNDMARVATETQKLLDYGEITLATIDLLVHRDVEQNIFNLSKHIANKNTAQALELYHELEQNGEEVMGMFGLLYNAYRRMYYLKTTKYSNDEYASYFGVKPNSLYFLKETADKYKPMQLKRALGYFAQTDALLRAHTHDDQAIEILIMQLCAL